MARLKICKNTTKIKEPIKSHHYLTLQQICIKCKPGRGMISTPWLDHLQSTIINKTKWHLIKTQVLLLLLTNHRMSRGCHRYLSSQSVLCRTHNLCRLQVFSHLRATCSTATHPCNKGKDNIRHLLAAQWLCKANRDSKLRQSQNIHYPSFKTWFLQPI